MILTCLQHTSTAGTKEFLLELHITRTTFSDPPSLVGTGSLDKAAIFNSEGNSVWATTAGFAPSAAELKEVVKSFTDTADVKAVQSTGFRIAGEKFITLRANERSLYGKKVCQNCAESLRQRVFSTSKAPAQLSHQTQRCEGPGMFPEQIRDVQELVNRENVTDIFIGQGRNCYCQNQAGHPRCTLPRNRTAWYSRYSR